MKLTREQVQAFMQANPETPTFNFPEGVTRIGKGAFFDCSGLTSIVIPESVKNIGDGAFHGCRGLTSIEIPKSVTSMGELVFDGCSGLKSVKLPRELELERIEPGTFQGCSNLTLIEIPKSISSIGVQAFYGCSGLTSIELPYELEHIERGAFSGCSSLREVKIPESMTSIGRLAFLGCSSLEEIKIPNSVTNIGIFAFEGCGQLSHVIAPKHLHRELETWGVNKAIMTQMEYNAASTLEKDSTVLPAIPTRSDVGATACVVGSSTVPQDQESLKLNLDSFLCPLPICETSHADHNDLTSGILGHKQTEEATPDLLSTQSVSLSGSDVSPKSRQSGRERPSQSVDNHQSINASQIAKVEQKLAEIFDYGHLQSSEDMHTVCRQLLTILNSPVSEMNSGQVETLNRLTINLKSNLIRPNQATPQRIILPPQTGRKSPSVQALYDLWVSRVGKSRTNLGILVQAKPSQKNYTNTNHAKNSYHVTDLNFKIDYEANFVNEQVHEIDQAQASRSAGKKRKRGPSSVIHSDGIDQGGLRRQVIEMIANQMQAIYRPLDGLSENHTGFMFLTEPPSPFNDGQYIEMIASWLIGAITNWQIGECWDIDGIRMPHDLKACAFYIYRNITDMARAHMTGNERDEAGVASKQNLDSLIYATTFELFDLWRRIDPDSSSRFYKFLENHEKLEDDDSAWLKEYWEDQFGKNIECFHQAVNQYISYKIQSLIGIDRNEDSKVLTLRGVRQATLWLDHVHDVRVVIESHFNLCKGPPSRSKDQPSYLDELRSCMSASTLFDHITYLRKIIPHEAVTSVVEYDENVPRSLIKILSDFLKDESWRGNFMAYVTGNKFFGQRSYLSSYHSDRSAVKSTDSCLTVKYIAEHGEDAQSEKGSYPWPTSATCDPSITFYGPHGSMFCEGDAQSLVNSFKQAFNHADLTFGVA